MDPVFAILVGLGATAIRIQREQSEAGRDARFLSIARYGWQMVKRRWSDDGVVGSKENGGVSRR